MLLESSSVQEELFDCTNTMSGRIKEQPSPNEEATILGETQQLDVEKLSHYLDLFKQWIATQKYLPQDYSKYTWFLL